MSTESLKDFSAAQSSDFTAENGANEPAGAGALPTITPEETEAQSNDPRPMVPDPESEAASPDTRHGGVLEDQSSPNAEILSDRTEVPVTVGREPESSTTSAPWNRRNGATDVNVHYLTTVDLEPRIDMEQPVSQGYVTHVSPEGYFVAQIKGPGLTRWERQTFAFDPQSPAEKVCDCTDRKVTMEHRKHSTFSFRHLNKIPLQQIEPLRWYVAHVKEPSGVDFFDRVMCMAEEGPYRDERGFLQLYFPDNGYEDFVDPSMVFDLENYDEINRVPVQVGNSSFRTPDNQRGDKVLTPFRHLQGVRIHAVGLTGRTPIEELRTAHPSSHHMLFLPADRSNCFMADCAVDVPHVYIYDITSKRVLC